MIQKYYFKSLLFLFLIFFHAASAQQEVAAKDDFVSVSNGTVNQLILANAMENDSLYGARATLNLVLLYQISTENPNLNLASDGSLTITPNDVAPGYYRIRYQICDINYPDFCSIATIHIFIGTCALTELYSTAVQNCFNTVVNFYDLPITDPWSMQIQKDGAPFSTVNGTGGHTQIPIPEPGNYSFQVKNTVTGCVSMIMEKIVHQQRCRTLSVTMFGSYNDYNADQAVNVGDVIDYHITVMNTAATPITNVSVTSASANISGNMIPVLAPISINNNAFTGRHVITQDDLNNGIVTVRADVMGTNADLTQQVNTYITQNAVVPVRKVAIKAFLDSNGNGTWDTDENDFRLGKVIAQSTNGGINRMCYSYLDLVDDNPDHSYNVSLEVFPMYTPYYTVNPNSFNDVHVPEIGNSTRNFAVTALPYTDIEIVLHNSVASPRPGFLYKNDVSIINKSPLPLASGSLTFTKDDLLTINTISVAETTPTANGFVYNFTNLQPFETRVITVTFQVPLIPVVNLGDLLTNSVTVTSVNDINPENNNSSLTSTVIGSYDPNDKTESHGGKIVKSEFSTNDYLTYTIRFENTGTANAINVKVLDVIDDQLDINSLKMVAASHNYSLQQSNNELSWTFAAIDLPPSVENTDTGKGYIVFQIKPKPGFAVGDIIPNTAEIYFDFNPAIVTEPCITEFVSTLAVADFDTTHFRNYPNPIQNNWTVFSDKQLIDSVQFYDVSGKIIHTKTVKNIKATIDLSFLSNGLYFAKVLSDGKSETFKLIKE